MAAKIKQLTLDHQHASVGLSTDEKYSMNNQNVPMNPMRSSQMGDSGKKQ